MLVVGRQNSALSHLGGQQDVLLVGYVLQRGPFALAQQLWHGSWWPARFYSATPAPHPDDR